MRRCAVALLSLVLAGLFMVPVSAANDERYGYITVESVQVQLQNDTALVDVHYSVDEGTRIIFFLMGKQDLKNKLLKILNYDDAQVQHLDLSSAEMIVQEASYSYGSGIYWYPSHQFNVVIPKLTVISPQVERTYTNTNVFPEGVGYFENQPATGDHTAPAATP
jgi:hypothetical protein